MRQKIPCISCGREFFTRMVKIKGVTPKQYVPENNQCRKCRNFMTMTQQKRKPRAQLLDENENDYKTTFKSVR